MKVTNIKENPYLSGDFVVPVAQTDEFGKTDWKGLSKSQLGGTSIQIPKLNLQINKNHDTLSDGLKDKRIVVNHPISEVDNFLSCNPMIVLVRKIKPKALIEVDGTRKVKKIKWGEPNNAYSGSIDPLVLPLSLDRDFQFNLQPTTQYYTPETISGSPMTVEGIVRPFVIKQETNGGVEYNLLTGFKKITRLFGINHPYGSINGIFGLCIRIENPNFEFNVDYPKSTFNGREPKYIYGPITKIRVGVQISEAGLEGVKPKENFFASIT